MPQGESITSTEVMTLPAEPVQAQAEATTESKEVLKPVVDKYKSMTLTMETT
jgi:hypothetical protein